MSHSEQTAWKQNIISNKVRTFQFGVFFFNTTVRVYEKNIKIYLDTINIPQYCNY